MRIRLLAFLTLCGLLALLAAPVASSGEKKPVAFSLADARDGKTVALSDFADRKAVVVVFVGTECPVNNQYMPVLARMAKDFEPRGVQFLAVNSNAQDNPARVAEHAKKHDLPFPVLKDPAAAVADRFGAKRTPEAVVLDGKRTVVYRGRIDDQYGVGFGRPKPTRRDLADALEAVLTGKPVERPTTEAPGCLIARVAKPKGEATVTYTKQVSRLLQKHCQECHRPGQIGPMPLLTYDDAASWAETIKEVVAEKRMPPWHADPKFGTFSNDRSLPEEGRKSLLAWIDGGCPKGDDKDLPPPRSFVSGWGVGKPDVVVSMSEEFDVPAETPKGGVPYQYFTETTDFGEDKWVTRAEAKPGAAEVVHHIIVYIVPPGETFVPGRPGRVLVGVAPGDTALVLPPGYAKKIPRGSQLVFQMHYTPDGKARKDRSSVGLVFAKEPPERAAITLGISNPKIRIPAGADDYKIESQFLFKEDGHILGFMPHMHLRGKSFRYEAVFPDGKTEVLLSVPRFDFNWQASYRLVKPYAMPKGSKVHCVAHFDNSEKNLNNPDSTKEVRWGDQTWEEMMIGWVEFVFDKKPQ